VIVTHDQEEALDIADSIAVLNEGRIEQVGDPTDLYDNPSNEFVFSFLGSVSTFAGKVVRPHDLRLERVRREGALVAEVVRVAAGPDEYPSPSSGEACPRPLLEQARGHDHSFQALLERRVAGLAQWARGSPRR
jgi:ABC-type Fe3+/spermidine/putrescine transport system ATPase subunit